MKPAYGFKRQIVAFQVNAQVLRRARQPARSDYLWNGKAEANLNKVYRKNFLQRNSPTNGYKFQEWSLPKIPGADMSAPMAAETYMPVEARIEAKPGYR
jgi:hypothetical protein